MRAAPPTPRFWSWWVLLGPCFERCRHLVEITCVTLARNATFILAPFVHCIAATVAAKPSVNINNKCWWPSHWQGITRLRFARFLKVGAPLPAAASHTSSVVQPCLNTQPFTHEIKLNPKSAAPHSAWQCYCGDADAKCSVEATCPGSPSHCIYAPRCSNISPSPHAPHPQRSTAHAQRPLSSAKVTA